MAAQPTYLTEAQYLELERRAERKSEYLAGKMFAMAGASRRHVLIATNLIRELSQRLRGRPCEVYSNDLRLQVSPTGLYTYPDVMVMCGKPEFADAQKDTLLNPAFIIEVLSDSTADYDLGRKFEHYRTLPSLMEYLTIAQDRPHIQQWTRQPNHWLLTEFDNLAQIMDLCSIDCVLPLAEVYDKVEWDTAQG